MAGDTYLMQPVSYDLDGAAAATGLSKRTLQVAIESGDLVANYSGRKPVITTEELREFIRALPNERPTRHR